VALLGDRVVGQGGTPQQALQAAKAARHKETPEVIFVPSTIPMLLPDLLDRIRLTLPPGIPVYLVGGAVRNTLLRIPIHDLDFVLPAQALFIARRVANKLGAAYYPLDEDRDTARLIYTDEQGKRFILDFASFRGEDLQADLYARDFTVNAMALDVRKPTELLDPLSGAADLHAKVLRACTPSTFISDPVRIVRGLRLAASFDLHIERTTREQMRLAVPRLKDVSPERLRDELQRILEGPKPHTALRALDMLAVLEHILPELSALKGLDQPAPHVKDAWEHTLDTLRYLEALLSVLGPLHDPTASATLTWGTTALKLGRYREQIDTHLKDCLVSDRSQRGLLFFGALYHDIGKPQTAEIDADGRIRFITHDEVGAQIIENRAVDLRFSNIEVNRLRLIVRHHMRPTWLAHGDHPPSARAIYRFFRATGPAGVDICLLSLADLLAAYGPTLNQDRWSRQIGVVRAMLEAWWEHNEEKVSPPALITGHDLINAVGLTPGPLIGEMLELVREAQVSGSVKSHKQALALVRESLSESG
jgi:putative nucleotidyltransferase with HDIG domain